MTAVTRYTVSRCWRRASRQVALVEARPETGRHHQVRAHLRSAGAPILFDRVYGNGSACRLDGAPLNRLALHASRLVVPRPDVPEDPLVLEAALPADLVSLRRWLDGEWGDAGIG